MDRKRNWRQSARTIALNVAEGISVGIVGDGRDGRRKDNPGRADSQRPATHPAIRRVKSRLALVQAEMAHGPRPRRHSFFQNISGMHRKSPEVRAIANITLFSLLEIAHSPIPSPSWTKDCPKVQAQRGSRENPRKAPYRANPRGRGRWREGRIGTAPGDQGGWVFSRSYSAHSGCS